MSEFLKRQKKLLYKVKNRRILLNHTILLRTQGLVCPSWGADSTRLFFDAKSTLSVFLDRPLKFGRSLYNKSAAYATIEHANPRL